MCVIAVCESARITPEEVTAMWNKNDQGGGIAWREEILVKGKATTVVKFQKGLMKLEEMQEAVAKAPLPFVAHFRIASIGGVTRYLTHPFMIDQRVPYVTKGQTEGEVLFHNGHWNEWLQWVKDALRYGAGSLRIPTGKWSDTRGMAWLAAVYGPGVLEFISEKVITMSPEKIEIFGSGWSWHGETGRMFMASNAFWKPELEKILRMKAFDGAEEHSAAVPFSSNSKGKTKESPLLLPSSTEEAQRSEERLTFPKDIGNAFRREQISFELVQAAHALQMISKKQFKKLSKVQERREWALARKLAESTAPQGVN